MSFPFRLALRWRWCVGEVSEGLSVPAQIKVLAVLHRVQDTGGSPVQLPRGYRIYV